MNERLTVAVTLVHAAARMPTRAYADDAAYDLTATESCTIAPQRRAVVGTGIAVAIPPGLAALTLPRSGLAARHGVALVNAPGLIDSGYRGEIRVILLNTDTEQSFTVRPGDRVAQMLFVGLPLVVLQEVDSLPGSERGERGFGSSGLGGEEA
jgi:dUTP pyrophosphatase